MVRPRMPSEPGSGRARRSLKVWVPLFLAVLVLAVLPIGLASASGVSLPAPRAVSDPVLLKAPVTPASAAAPSYSPTSAPSPLQPQPLTGSVTADFYQNTTGFAIPGFLEQGCSVSSFSSYQYDYCYPQAVDPTLVNLGNGKVGIGYQYATNQSSISCSAYVKNVHQRIGFSVSSDNGTTFGSPTSIGNNTCKYLQAIEPSFAASGNSVYGTFVEENVTNSRPGYYTSPRPNDGLAFVVSTNNGASFSAPVTLNKSGNISHPEIAAFGNSVYIVFENVSNGSTRVMAGGPYCYSFCTAYPGSVWFIYSTDGGAHWTGPKLMPGMNSSVDDFSINPSIAVNKTGTVAVSYFTNQSCVWYYSIYCNDLGLDLQVFTSTTNGSSFNGPFTVARGVGESYYYYGYSFTGPTSQWEPQDQVIFSPTGQTIYLTWSGMYNRTDLWQSQPYNNYCCGGIFFASGSVSGTSWTVSPVHTDYTSGYYDDMYNPAVGYRAGTLYLTYTWNNETYCFSGCEYTSGTLNQRVVTSTNGGLTWSSPAIASVVKSYSYCTSSCATSQFEGYQASVAFAANGAPLYAYAMPNNYHFSYVSAGGISYYNYTYPTNLLVAKAWSGSTVTLTVTENNLPAATTWSFQLQGQTFATNSQSLQVTNVPMGEPFVIAPNTVPGGYGEIINPESSVPGVATLNANGTVYFNYSVSYQLLLFIEPALTPYFVVSTTYNGTYYEVYGDYYCYIGCFSFREWYTSNPYAYSTSPLAWYFPTGAKITFQQQSYATAFVDYWNGTGMGSYNGTGLFLNLTIGGPVNETGWIGGFGLYNETFNAQGLPSASTYSFGFNGQAYSASSTSSVIATNVSNGAYAVSDITATSSTSGWEYFGTPDTGTPVVVPAEPIVNFTFAYVDVAAAEGTVSFHAVGLTAGTVWRFSFNGTEYSSSIPWINVTTRPGTFPVGAYPVVASNGSAGYTPSGVPSTMSVTTGSTYAVNFVSAFQVVVTAGIGGSVSGGRGSLWFASGSTPSFHAVASPGYTFGGWSSTGLGGYTGSDTYANITVNGPITESAGFFPLPQNRFNLSFVETGLPGGTWWTVFLGNVGYSTNQQTLKIENLYPCGPLGTYNLTVPYAYVNGTSLTRYSPGGYPATMCTNGATIQNIQFNAQYYLTLGSTAGGIAEATIGANSYTSSTWVANGTSVLLSALAGSTYQFLGWNGSGLGSYTGPTPNVGIVMANPITEIAAFAHPYVPPAITYWVDFHVSAAFAAGTAWTVSVGGVGYSSTGTDLNVSGLQVKSYTLGVVTVYSPDGLTRYTPIGAPTSVSVTHNQTVALSFSTSYWVSITANFGGNISQPTTPVGWVASGLTITLNATPISGYQLLGWTGTGSASYTGTDSVHNIVVSSPITEVAGFGLQPPSAAVVTSSMWSAPTTWIGLAVVGLVVGLLVGLLLGRRGGARPAATDQPWSEETEGAANPPPPSGEEPGLEEAPEGGS